MDTIELKGLAVTVLVVGAAAVIFFGVLSLVAMRFRGSNIADAWLDLYGHGAEQPC